jgi:hypothetical protein
MTRLRWWFAISLVFCACDEQGVECFCDNNQPPAVWLAAGPAEGSTVDNPVHFYWGGWDADGGINGFEYLLTQNPGGSLSPPDTIGVPWMPLHGNDSTFTAKPDSLNISRSFTFFIRAVDNEGLRSRETPHRTFRIKTP